MPPTSILLHVSGYRSGEGLSFLSDDINGDRDVEQVCPMSILFSPISPKVCRVPRAKATQLDQGSRGGSTSGGECSASWVRSQLAPSLFKFFSETRLAPSRCQTQWVLSWSLSSLFGSGSLTLGGEPLSTAYRGSFALDNSCDFLLIISRMAPLPIPVEWVERMGACTCCWY